jgi:hypothetical protein
MVCTSPRRCPGDRVILINIQAFRGGAPYPLSRLREGQGGGVIGARDGCEKQPTPESPVPRTPPGSGRNAMPGGAHHADG